VATKGKEQSNQSDAQQEEERSDGLLEVLERVKRPGVMLRLPATNGLARGAMFLILLITTRRRCSISTAPSQLE
jgi:hypothetical protein